MADEERDDEQSGDEEREQRLFNRQEAEALLPLLQRELAGARENKRRVVELDRDFSQVQNRIQLAGGYLPSYALLAQKRVEREMLVSALREAVARIESNGCVVKDIDLGLVDFLTVLNDEQVFLCWKLGEPAIRYWHRTDEDYTGRKPLGDGKADAPDERKLN